MATAQGAVGQQAPDGAAAAGPAGARRLAGRDEPPAGGVGPEGPRAPAQEARVRGVRSDPGRHRRGPPAPGEGAQAAGVAPRAARPVPVRRSSRSVPDGVGVHPVGVRAPLQPVPGGELAALACAGVRRTPVLAGTGAARRHGLPGLLVARGDPSSSRAEPERRHAERAAHATAASAHTLRG